MAYTIVSSICIAAMGILLAYLAGKFFSCGRAEKIEFIKSFKKGKCAIIYLIAIPIFLMNNLYLGEDLAISIFNSISKAVYLVVLKYDISIDLIAVNSVYAVAVYLCFSLVILNALMITISVLHEYIWETLRLIKFMSARKEQCIILGNNERSKMIYRSCKCRTIIAGTLKRDAREKLYIDGYSYKSFVSEKRLESWIQKRILGAAGKKGLSRFLYAQRRLRIIINFDHEQQNLAWCGKFVDLLRSADDRVVMAADVYVFGDREYEDIYSRYEASAKGCLHYINEYQQIAIDFIDKYPLTEFMDGRHIDYQTNLLDPETEINVAMIGFGRTNQQIFLSMVANSQYLTRQDGKIVPMPVHYHLFDKLHINGHKNLNHNAFRFRLDFFSDGAPKVNEDEYLPLPALPSHEIYHDLDINDSRFYENLDGAISFHEKAINYVIVSLGTDYASIDMANKLEAKRKERGLKNVHIFVRIREKEVFDDAPIFLDLAFCHPFGSNRDVVFDYAHIIREKFAEMAMLRNFVYNIERDMLHECVTQEQRYLSRKRWYLDLTSTERESNVYACLSLRSKLHLMGLDYCAREEDIKNGTRHGLTLCEYYAIYARDDMPDIIMDEEGTERAIRYSLDFKHSNRENMAIQEHQRWNAFMISKGFIPATKEQILCERFPDGRFTNGKNYALRRHGNLTTYEGLKEFRRMIASRDGENEEKYDVIKYDYQLMDGAWWLLNESGFQMIRRGNETET